MKIYVVLKIHSKMRWSLMPTVIYFNWDDSFNWWKQSCEWVIHLIVANIILHKTGTQQVFAKWKKITCNSFPLPLSLPPSLDR